VQALSPALGALELADGPTRIGGGLDTYTYAFRLSGSLDPHWLRPLVLRVYPSPDQQDKAKREEAVQRFVHAAGFPAPLPLLVVIRDTPLGLPFMIMERAPGSTMLDRFKNPLAIDRMLRLLADTQVRLHRVPLDGCPLDGTCPLADRLLDELRETTRRVGLTGQGEALEWLDRNRPAEPQEDVVLCHNDCHPLNLLVDDSGRAVVIDWSDAAVGDRHSDVARTTALFWLAPPLAGGLTERVLLRVLRGYLIRSYVRHYSASLAVDPVRLRYWQVLHAVRAWALLDAMRSAGPVAVGAKDDAAAAIPDALLPALEQYVRVRTSGG